MVFFVRTSFPRSHVQNIIIKIRPNTVELKVYSFDLVSNQYSMWKKANKTKHRTKNARLDFNFMLSKSTNIRGKNEFALVLLGKITTPFLLGIHTRTKQNARKTNVIKAYTIDGHITLGGGLLSRAQDCNMMQIKSEYTPKERKEERRDEW